MTDIRPGGQPDPWRLVMDQLNRIEANMLTRGEFSAHQQRFDGAISDMNRRIDEVQTRALQTTSEWRAESIAAHKEFDRELEVLRTDISDDRKEKQKESSQRRFTLAMSLLAGGLSVVTGVVVFVVQGVLGG